jgi:hypothetical protein
MLPKGEGNDQFVMEKILQLSNYLEHERVVSIHIFRATCLLRTLKCLSFSFFS